ncbi:MAG: hypothetical protein ACUVSM_06455 [Armatimonadota bacterium]|jgi:hypothetical protein
MNTEKIRYVADESVLLEWLEHERPSLPDGTPVPLPVFVDPLSLLASVRAADALEEHTSPTERLGRLGKLAGLVVIVQPAEVVLHLGEAFILEERLDVPLSICLAACVAREKRAALLSNCGEAGRLEEAGICPVLFTEGAVSLL